MKTLLWMYVASGILLALAAVPLMLRRVGPNPVYGFRLPKTLANPDVWYAVNAYSGVQMFWIGLGTVALSVGAYFVPRLDVATYATICAVFVLGALAVSVFFSFRYMNRL